MEIIISPNSFKGTFSSIDACNIIAEGLLNYDSKLNIKKLPIADGGDGTLEIFKYYFDYDSIKESSVNSIGEKIQSEYIIIENGKTAIIEFANTCGLAKVDFNKNDLNISNSLGFGLQVKSAIETGVENIILTLGGSATIDGGCGAMIALGVKFYDDKENIIKDKNPIVYANSIDFSSSIVNKKNINFTILSDVNNTIFGNNGCVNVYGKQKGLKNSQIPIFENYLKKISLKFKKKFNKNISNIKSGGAAGGAAGFLKLFLNAELHFGSEYIFNKINYCENINEGSILITGEGRIDEQTLNMKAPFSLVNYLKNKNIFSVAIGGIVDYKCLNILLKSFDLIFSTSESNDNIKSLSVARKNLLTTSFEIAGIIKHKINNNYINYLKNTFENK